MEVPDMARLPDRECRRRRRVRGNRNEYKRQRDRDGKRYGNPPHLSLLFMAKSKLHSFHPKYSFPIIRTKPEYQQTSPRRYHRTYDNTIQGGIQRQISLEFPQNQRVRTKV
jgi:hypothetical protein